MGIQWSSINLFTTPNPHGSNHDAFNDRNKNLVAVIGAEDALKQKEIRTYNTAADKYFQKHNKLILPSIPHAFLNLRKKNSNINASASKEFSRDGSVTNQQKSKGVLVIGDVHGCFEELNLLLNKAQVEYNNCVPFASVILVGDLVNKGPLSAEVIQYMREKSETNNIQMGISSCRSMQDDVEKKNEMLDNKYNQVTNFYAVRGNHDNAALKRALSPKKTGSGNDKYAWLWKDENITSEFQDKESKYVESNLSDKDVMWMSELPYTITIPWELLEYYSDASLPNLDQQRSPSKIKDEDSLENSTSTDTIVVHAGFIPGIEIQNQTVETMVTIRDIEIDLDLDKGFKNEEEYNASIKKSSPISKDKYVHEMESNKRTKVPWATLWKGDCSIFVFHTICFYFQFCLK